MSKPANSVDQYLQTLPASVRQTLEAVRKAVKSAAPDADEVISYRIPVYKYRGDLVAFMAARNHCSFITMSHPLVKALKQELKLYHTSGTTIHFPLDKPLPDALVKKIVKARLKENEEKAGKKKSTAK
jgi:uncharacterized protein YdhG (YjbR/CyaY superfamily)